MLWFDIALVNQIGTPTYCGLEDPCVCWHHWTWRQIALVFKVLERHCVIHFQMEMCWKLQFWDEAIMENAHLNLGKVITSGLKWNHRRTRSHTTKYGYSNLSDYWPLSTSHLRLGLTRSEVFVFVKLTNNKNMWANSLFQYRKFNTSNVKPLQNANKHFPLKK